MDLLPKTASSSDINSAEYWESFVKKNSNKSKAFEWYGEYPILCGILHKYIRASDKSLIIGCGSCQLSEDLYDVGYHQLTNIDDAESVVKQKTMKNAKKRPELKFEQMDATQMTYDDSSFSVVLDKGNLDARMKEKKEEAEALVDKMFGEIGRVLKVGGRYICITIALENLISKLLSYFSSE
nr:eEF1A lysine and N-terminal methyltransferase-like [Lytechinus pictus]